MFKKWITKLIEKEARRIAHNIVDSKIETIKEEMEKDVLKKQVEILKTALSSKGNLKPLHDTVIFIDYYINVDGLSIQRAQEEIQHIIDDYTFTEAFVRAMGLKQIHQQFIPSREGNTRIEYQLV